MKLGDVVEINCKVRIDSLVSYGGVSFISGPVLGVDGRPLVGQVVCVPEMIVVEVQTCD